VAGQMVRIIGGEFRGRLVPCEVHSALRPTPDRVREALFNILAFDIEGKRFIDIFAGTGVVGLEALGRGATEAWFVEWDGKNAAEIQKLADRFRVGARARPIRADAYRWLELWTPPPDELILFFSPPFPDLLSKPDQLVKAVEGVITRLAPGSIVVVQVETPSKLPWREDLEWDQRKYGRNLLLIHRLPGGRSAATEDQEVESDNGDESDVAESPTK